MDNEALATLDQVFLKTSAAAGPVIQHSFPPQTRMGAAELLEFWGPARIAALATVSASGRPHAIPVVAYLHGARFYFQCEPEAVKLRDVHANQSVALTAWASDGLAVIVQGTARQLRDEEVRGLPDSLSAPSPFGPAACVEIAPTRITMGRPPMPPS